MPPPEDYADWSPPPDNASGRHNVPFVRLTQSEYVSSSEQETTRASTKPGSLYTITEITERTEDSKDWGSATQMLHGRPRDSRTTIVSSTSTDYGQVVAGPRAELQFVHEGRVRRLRTELPLQTDPNDIPPSPSSSAARRLSQDIGSPTGPPQIDYSSPSDSTVSSHLPTVLDLPPFDNMPDIPDYKSKSSLPHGPSQASLHTKKSTRAGDDAKSQLSEKSGKLEKKSKLSALASSRSSAKSSARSSASSVTSRSSVTETEVATAMTYPALRPAASSFVSLLPPRPPSSVASDSTTPSSLTRNVLQAIQSALVLEELDRQAQTAEHSTVPPTPPPKSTPRGGSTTPSEFPEKSPSPIPLPPTVFAHALSPAPGSPPAAPRSPPPVLRSPPSSPPHAQIAPSTSPPAQPRQLSKLAKLAQTKAQEQGKGKAQSMSQPGMILPRTHTEYLTPTANGSTATTAITTSYQSLSGLLSKNPLKGPSSLAHPPPTNGKASPQTKSSQPKQSKLAMKSKTARAKASAEPEPEPDEVAPVIEVPMFSPSAIRSRALPSAFATLLVSDDHETASVTSSEGTHLCNHHQAERERRRSRRDHSDSSKPRSHRHKEHESLLLPPGPLPNMRGFAFDVPSPDDVVLHARRGTSMGQRSTSSTHSALTASAR
ncbi:hypothetical protein K466DRAFT_538835 [Polyporus arcularius HHB13444]|uniref:Uncharacterized protein n=1 Tax=Polyporus arcularius HHB13444 TaxID=1314778 RepID=A0A5C3Q3D7_9APHY|nr:hypothetical protein K466DRAFT_538835 [Polyporus arcularius HHB13444]